MAGDESAGIAAAEQARELVRAGFEADPEDADLARELGSMCYALGEWRYRRGEYATAVTTLDEAERAYHQLMLSTMAERFIAVGSLDESGPPAFREARRLIADVAVRRARANWAQEAYASALVDVQAAVIVYRRQAGRDPALRVEAARVFAWTATVLLLAGDPDLACATADWSIRVYLEQFHQDGLMAIPEPHASAFYHAVGVARSVHAAANRGQAEWLAELARYAPSPYQPVLDAYGPDLVQDRPTLRQVLDRLDPALGQRITAPPTEVRILVPHDRCDPAQRSTVASRLAALAEAEFAAGRHPAGTRLALEAHALFSPGGVGPSAGSTVPPPAGVVWARLLLSAASQLAEVNPGLASDLAGWLARITNQDGQT